jgi:hypothetical protein
VKPGAFPPDESRGLGFTVPGPNGTIRERVRAIVAHWAGLDPGAVPDSHRICEIWDANPENPRLDEFILSVLVREIRKAFPGVDVVLGALANATAADLIRYVESRG